MGVQGLWKLIEPSGRIVPLESMNNKVLAVDVSIWLHQAMKGMHDIQGAPVAIAHLLVLFHRLCKLLFYKIKPVFVFDGAVPELKRQTMNARRVKKSAANSEASRVRNKLLKNLLKHEALRNVLSDEAATSLLGLGSLNLPGPSEEEDLYKLPEIAVPASPSNSSKSCDERSDDEESSHMDIYSVDLTSDSFKALPAETRHEILSDIKDTRKQNSWGTIDQMPSGSQDFSDFQMNRLLKRRAVQSALEDVGKEVEAQDVSMQDLQGLLGAQFSGGLVQTGRIAQEDSTRYILIQKPKDGGKSESGKIEEPKTLIDESKGFDINEHLDEVQWSSDSDSCNYSPLDSSNDEDSEMVRTKKPRIDALRKDEPEIKLEENTEAAKTPRKTLRTDTAHAQKIRNILSGKSDAADILRILENSDDDNSKDVKSEEVKECETISKSVKPEEVKESEIKSKEIESEVGLVTSPSKSVKSEEVNESNRSHTVQSEESEKQSRRKEMHDLPGEHHNPTEGKPTDKAHSIEHQVAFQCTEIDEPPKQVVIELCDKKVDTHLAAEVQSKKALKHDEVPSVEPAALSNLLTGDFEKNTAAKETNTEDGNKNFSEVLTMAAKENLRNPIEIVGRMGKFSGSPVVTNVDENSSDIEENRAANEKTAEDRNKDFSQVLAMAAKENLKNPIEVVERLRKLSENPVLANECTTTNVDKISSSSESDDDFVAVESDDVPITSGNVEMTKEKEIVENTKSVQEQNPDLFSGASVSDIVHSLNEERDALMAEGGRQARLAQNVTDQMYTEAQELLRLFGVPYIVAPMEAEAQCATLNHLGLTEGTITDDSDIWLFGGRTVYKNFFNQKKHVLEYRSEDIEQYFNLTREEMIKLALLVGSDYTSGLTGIGPVTALEVLAAFRSPSEKGSILSGLKRFKEWVASGFVVGPTRVALKSKIKNIKLIPGFPSEAVVEGYLNPYVDKSDERFSWAKPDVKMLQNFTRLRFGWSAEKCNELIMPVMKKLMQTTDQTTIERYFKVASKPDLTDKFLSKRVEGAIKKLGRPVSEMEADDPEPSTSRPKKQKIGQISAEGLDPAVYKLHQDDWIPQKHMEQKRKEQLKKKAAELFKSGRGRGKSKSAPSRKEPQLSESSSDSG